MIDWTRLKAKMERDIKSIVEKLLALFDEIESYEFYKQNLLNSIDKLFEGYQEGKYTHAEHQKLLKDMLKNKPKEEWVNYYNSYIWSLLNQAEPLISQIIVFMYNDDSANRLKVSAKPYATYAAKEKEGRETRPAHVSIEEDKADVLKTLGRIKEGESRFVEVESQGILGRIKSSLQKKLQEEQQPIARIDLEELKRADEKREKKGIDILTKGKIWVHSYLERRRLKKGRKQISRELEKAKKLSFAGRIMLAARTMGAAKKAKPVAVEEPLHKRILDSLRSKFRAREKLEFKGVETRITKIAGEEKAAAARPSGRLTQDKDLEKLFAGLEKINREKAGLKAKEPKESIRLKIDLFIIRLHAQRRKKRVEKKIKVSAKGPTLLGVLSQKAAEAVDSVLERIRVKKPAAAKEEEVKKLKEELVPEKVKEGLKIEAPKARPSLLQEISARAAARVKKTFEPLTSKLFVKVVKEEPAKAKKAAPAAEKPKAIFKYGFTALKEWYARKAERERVFITPKTKILPSMQMESLKSRITAPLEVEKITTTLLREEVESIKKIVEEGKKFKVYKPSIIGSFANVMVRRFTFYLIDRYPAFFKDLYDNLRLSNMPVLSNTYVNIMLLATMFSSAVSAILFFLFFITTRNPLMLVIPKTAMMVILVGTCVFLVFFMYPQIRASGREKDINTNLPFAINHISAVAGSGVPPTKMFGLIVESKEYGEVATEIEKIVEYIELFGYDLLTAIRSVASTTPSKTFKEFLEGIVSTIEAGGDIKEYLKQKAAEAMIAYELERQEYMETIATLSDVYTGILIAAPLFFIVALSLVSMLGGTIGGMGVNTVIVLGGYVVIPLMNIGFLILLELTQPEM